MTSLSLYAVPCRTASRAGSCASERFRTGIVTIALAMAMLVSAAGRADAIHPHHGFGGHCFAPVGWHGGWHGGWGAGARFGGMGWGGPAFVGGWGWPAAGWGGCSPVAGWGWGWPGWGFGGCYPAFGTVSYGTGFWIGGTRFWSGSTVFGVPFWNGWGWGGCGPGWWGGAPFCGGPLVGGWGGGGWGGGGFGGPAAWYGGWNVGSPAGWNPPTARGWLLPMAARVPGHRRPAGALLAARPAGAERAGLAPFGGRELLGTGAIDERVLAAARTTNAPTRARAARLVGIGDGHLRAALEDPKRLAKAIDAYRRASAIAPHDPDIRLRQAIALTAAGKKEAAAGALSRAVAIDGRLAEPLPGGPRESGLLAATTVDRRSGALLERIFVDDAADSPADPRGNWIAGRWNAREGALAVVAAGP